MIKLLTETKGVLVMILRDDYLNKLIAYEEADLIRVITGVRRSGKSTILEMYKSYLSQNRPGEIIVHINLEDLPYISIRDKKDLLKLLIDELGDIKHNTRYHLLLDEIQLVNNWEEVVNGLYGQKNVKLVITGSNAKLLSSELSTLLAGRYVEIKVLPLSFNEFLKFKGVENREDLQKHFQNFLDYGSFPGTVLSRNENLQRDYLEGLYASILIRDIVSRYQIRDAGALQSIVSFVFEMIGRPIVINNLVNTIKSAGGSTSYETINKYIDALLEAFVIYSVEMYDVKGRKKLTASRRYYIVDTGLRNIRVNPSAKNMGSLLENIVYLELIRRGYRVYAGSIDGYEIDFIAEKPGEKKYVQVSMSILDESTKERELRPLNLIKDNYPKYILTLDDYDLSENGIIHENIIDFLL